jgi:hypothetical protein
MELRFGDISIKFWVTLPKSQLVLPLPEKIFFLYFGMKTLSGQSQRIKMFHVNLTFLKMP